jgi:hypothetical protein
MGFVSNDRVRQLTIYVHIHDATDKDGGAVRVTSRYPENGQAEPPHE